MKIDHNPFAKGFRDEGAGKREKKRVSLRPSENLNDICTNSPVPSGSEDEELPRKRAKPSEKISPSLGLPQLEIPRISPQFLAQWQMLFSLGIPPLLTKFKDSLSENSPKSPNESVQVPLKKGGFDVSALLSRPS